LTEAATPRGSKKVRFSVVERDEVTELSEAVLEEWRNSTSDIVRYAIPPRLRPLDLGVSAVPSPDLATRMELPNTAGLCPELLEIFSWTMRDGPLPFKLRRGYDCAGPLKRKGPKRKGIVTGEQVRRLPASNEGSPGQAFDVQLAEETMTPFKELLPSAPLELLSSKGATTPLKTISFSATPTTKLFSSSTSEFKSPKGVMKKRTTFRRITGKWYLRYELYDERRKTPSRVQIGSYSSQGDVSRVEMNA
jgi:hypothetical protein